MFLLRTTFKYVFLSHSMLLFQRSLWFYFHGSGWVGFGFGLGLGLGWGWVEGFSFLGHKKDLHTMKSDAAFAGRRNKYWGIFSSILYNFTKLGNLSTIVQEGSGHTQSKCFSVNDSLVRNTNLCPSRKVSGSSHSQIPQVRLTCSLLHSRTPLFSFQILKLIFNSFISTWSLLGRCPSYKSSMQKPHKCF